MKLLAIDTTEEGCSAALHVSGEVHSRFQRAPRQHTEMILPMMDELMAEAGLKPAQLDGLAFGRGPGAFTGIRIATGVIQGVALGADLPVVPVSSLLALAQRAHREFAAEQVLAAFDARMNEVYWAACRLGVDGLMAFDGEERVCLPDAVPVPGEGHWLGVGSGWASYGDSLHALLADRLSGVQEDLLSHAHDVAQLGVAGLAAGRGVAAELALPVYLRDQVAWKKVGQQG